MLSGAIPDARRSNSGCSAEQFRTRDGAIRAAQRSNSGSPTEQFRMLDSAETLTTD